MTLVPTQRRRIERKVLPRGDEAPGRKSVPPGGFPRRGYRTPGRSRRVDGAPGSGRGVPYFQGPAAGRGGLTSRAATRRSVRSPPPNSTPRPLTTVSAPLRSCRNPGSGVSTRPPATGTHPCPSPEPVYRRRTPAPPRSITLLPVVCPPPHPFPLLSYLPRQNVRFRHQPPLSMAIEARSPASDRFTPRVRPSPCGACG